MLRFPFLSGVLPLLEDFLPFLNRITKNEFDKTAYLPIHSLKSKESKNGEVIDQYSVCPSYLQRLNWFISIFDFQRRGGGLPGLRYRVHRQIGDDKTVKGDAPGVLLPI